MTFQVGFPSGQYAAHGIDLDTAMALEEAFQGGTDPQPIIERIADPEVREVAQRITENLAKHPARGRGSSPNDINWGYVTERVRRYNQEPSDDLLYRLGTHCNALTVEDQDLIQKYQQGCLNPEQRFRILNWIAYQRFVGFVGLEIEHDLALLIFGRNQLQEWLERSQQVYPNFEFYLAFEAGTIDADPQICFTMHWLPKPGAPQPCSDCDFPWQPWWDSGDMFWGALPGGCINQFDFNLFCYPDQESFAVPGKFCQEGDRYTTLTQEEADLMSVAQVLEHFAVQV